MKLHIVLFATVLAACTNGQGEVDVTATNVATFPAPPASQKDAPGAGTVMVDAAITLDLQKDLASLSGVGTLTAALSKNAVSGSDLSVVRRIEATIASEDGTLPLRILSDVDVPPGSAEVEMPLVIDNSLLLDYLTEGKVAVHFYLTGDIPGRSLTLTHTIIAHVSIAVDKSVLKL
jgi:hypothetical protein